MYVHLISYADRLSAQGQEGFVDLEQQLCSFSLAYGRGWEY